MAVYMHLMLHAYNTALGTMCGKSSLVMDKVPTFEWYIKYAIKYAIKHIGPGSNAMVTRDISYFSYFQCY